MSDINHQQAKEQSNEGHDPNRPVAADSDASNTEQPSGNRRQPQSGHDDDPEVWHKFGLKLYELLSLILLAVLIFVNIVYAVYAGRQWETMEKQLVTYYAQLLVSRDTLNQMKSSSETSAKQTDQIITQANTISGALATANDQNKQAVDKTLKQSEASITTQLDNSKLDQRAWLGLSSFQVDQFEKGKSLKVTLELRNTGKTPALSVQNGAANFSTSTLVQAPPQEMIEKIVLTPAQSVPPQGGFSFHIEIPDKNLQNHFDAIENRTEFLYLIGKFTYTDVSHTFSGLTEFCLMLQPQETGKRPELAYCASFNDIR